MTTINKQDLISVRAYQPEDRNFILATWLRGLYYGDTWYNKIPKAIFMEQYHFAIENILKNPNIKILVSCLKDDQSVILGYAIYRDLPSKLGNILILDWMFVKSAWRKIGIAKELLKTETRACTHLTKAGESIIKKHNLPIIFNPFLLNQY